MILSFQDYLIIEKVFLFITTKLARLKTFNKYRITF